MTRFRLRRLLLGLAVVSTTVAVTSCGSDKGREGAQARKQFEHEGNTLKRFVHASGGERLTASTRGGLQEHVHVGRDAHGHVCVDIEATNNVGAGLPPSSIGNARCTRSAKAQRQILVISNSASKHGQVLLSLVGYAGCRSPVRLRVDGRAVEASSQRCLEGSVPSRTLTLPAGRTALVETPGLRQRIRLSEFTCPEWQACLAGVTGEGRPEY